MSNTARIQGDKGYLQLELLDYENRQAVMVDDANWLRAELEVKAGPFTGAIALSLTAAELELLLRELARAASTLVGSVDFVTMEGNLRLKLEFERTGVALIQGVISVDEAEDNALHYEFRSDPISLEAAVQNLTRLVSNFPAKRSIQPKV